MKKKIDLPHIKGEIEIADDILQSEEVKEFFSRPNIKSALERDDLDYLYKEWNHDLLKYTNNVLTQIFLAADIDILEYLTELPPDAFGYCRSLTSIIIPEGITEIGEYAFFECKNLKSITIPESVITMYGYVFESCKNLETIYCKAKEKPKGWRTYWLGDCKAKVIWGA